MEENLKIYNSIKSVPNEAQKLITGGRLSGMTDIKPMWRIEKLTEVFGPCGIGWKAPIKNKEIFDGANGEKIAIVDIDLFVKVDGQWSEPIEGTGGSSFVANEKGGLYTSDECFKMAYTDALSVACKSLGMGAEIYWGDSKYKTNKIIETKEEAEKYVLLYGKHKDKTLKEVQESDLNYLNWLYNNEGTNDTIKSAIKLLLDMKEDIVIDTSKEGFIKGVKDIPIQEGDKQLITDMIQAGKLDAKEIATKYKVKNISSLTWAQAMEILDEVDKERKLNFKKKEEVF